MRGCYSEGRSKRCVVDARGLLGGYVIKGGSGCEVSIQMLCRKGVWWMRDVSSDSMS